MNAHERKTTPDDAPVVVVSNNSAKLCAQVEQLQEELAVKDKQLQSLRGLLEARDAVLQSILNSKGWRLMNKYRDARNYLVKEIGFGIAARVLRRRMPISATAYRGWIRQREKRVTAGRAAQEIAGFGYKPKVSIIMPVYNTRREYLDKAIESVRAQYYDDWELCVCDDASPEPHIRPLLEDWSRRDTRVKVVFSPVNEGISAASNRALELASGEFVGLLDHDDELTPDALFEVVKLLQQHEQADAIYSDEDKLEADGSRSDPFFKPDWSPEYLLSYMYTCHFGVYRKALIDSLGGFRRGFEGSQDYDLMLRVSERTDRIVHVAKVLYHWRKTQSSTAARSGAKTFTSEAGRLALEEHLQRRGIQGTVVSTMPNRYRVRPNIVGEPLVSIIIATKDHPRLLARCIASIETKTAYRKYEIIVADNGSTGPAMKTLAERLRHKVVPFPEPFNFSRINNFAARHASGEYLLFLNDDTEARAREWMTAMLELCQLPGVGAVGAKLLFPSGRVQHAGVVLGFGGVAGHPYYQERGSSRGYFHGLHSIRNYSAVTAACMMVRRPVFENIGGFDEDLPLNYNDVDFCLRVRRAGYRVVWTPYAELYHHESASREPVVKADEIWAMHERWGELLLNDPYYNPNLTLERGDYSLRM